MAYKIQQLGIGGILDQAIAITKDHFVLLLSIMLLLMIPYNLVAGLVSLAIMPVPSFMPTPEQMAELQAAQLRNWPILAAIGLIGGLVVLPVTNAAVIWAVARLYLGQPVTAIEAIGQGFRRLLPLLGTTILMYLAIFGGLILCIIPGILFALWFGLSQHVVMIEGLAGPAALGRSKKLVSANFGTFLVLGLLLFVIFAAVGVGAAFVPQPYVRLVVQTLAQAMATIISTAAGVVFYFSARCVVDNFDLHYLAESIGAQPAVVDESVPVR